MGNGLDGDKWSDHVKLSQVSFSLIGLTWVIDILLEKLTPQIGDWIWKTPSAHYFSWVGDFM